MKKTIIKETIPENITNRVNSKYEFYSIKAGEACLYEGTQRELINVRSAAIEYAKRHKLHFVTRTNDKGLMVYNVADITIQKPVNIDTSAKGQPNKLTDQLKAAGIAPANPFEV